MTMENITNNYTQNSGRHLQFPSEQRSDLDSNILALDLSRKKHVALPEITKEKITVELPQSLLANVKRYQQINLPEEDRQTPIAGSSAMLSPYSESNSPKRMKTESSINYYKINNQLKHFATFRRDVIPGVTMVTPQQPSLPVLQKEAPKIPVMMPTMSIPYVERSPSFMTNNEASRKILLAVPAEYSPSVTDVRLPTASLDTVKKASRPFKAYSKNYLSVAPTFDYTSNEDYAKFREMMLENVKKANGNIPNPKMRRVSKSPGLPTSTVDEKDAAYWERRRKNNEAAKRSRDARRAKEDELAIRTAYLENENFRLRCELENVYERLYLLNSQP